MLTAKEAMDYAVEHSFERKSVLTEKALKAAALVQGVGSVTVEDIHRQIADANILRKEKAGVRYATTKKVYEEELEMVAFARSLSEIDFAECRINHLQAISDWSLSVSD